MGHRDLNAEEEHLLLKRESLIKSRLSTDNLRDAVPGIEKAAAVHGAAGMPMASNPTCNEFSLDKRWLIDPHLLFVGAKIGEGAHGIVYEGRYRGMSVAVKILQRPEKPEEQAKLEARFAREIDMMTRVQHRNLVKFVGACKEPLMAIATELLPGVSLRKHMMSLRPERLELRLAIGFALDIAQAMDCLHANGIIHRDLKSDNLLLTVDMKSVKLVDFGLAREESVTEMMTAETGTYRWMAPELYSTVTLRQGDKKYYNNKVDVYSFGIVMWELLTNRLPFEGMSNLQAAYAAAFKNARPSLPDGLPEELVFILQSCWAEDPNVRPNFGQVVRMLTAFLSTLPETELLVPHQNFAIRSSNLLESPNIRSNSLESPNTRLVKDEMSDNSGLVNRPRRLFSCFGQCFTSGPANDLT